MNAGFIHRLDNALDWPTLAAPYDQALRAAVEDVPTHCDPIGIVAAGSILRGQGGPTSDIDLYVIHQAPFRQRLQRRYAGVPCEVFINPPQQIRRYFEDEHASARPITAHMLTSGFVVLDLDPVVQILRAEAASWLATPPNPTVDALRWRRYMIVDLLDNARDLIGVDAEMARLIVFQALHQLAEYRFLAANRHFPRLKATLAELDALDPSVGRQARNILSAVDVDQALALTMTLADDLLGVNGFFEWDSIREPEP